MEIIETFGQRVMRLRNERNLTRKELADKSGITTANIRIIEKDAFKKRLRVSTVMSLAKALEVEYEDLEM